MLRTHLGLQAPLLGGGHPVLRAVTSGQAQDRGQRGEAVRPWGWVEGSSGQPPGRKEGVPGGGLGCGVWGGWWARHRGTAARAGAAPAVLVRPAVRVLTLAQPCLVSRLQVSEEDLEQALLSSIKCAILAAAGPQRSRMLATLYKARPNGVCCAELHFRVLEPTRRQHQRCCLFVCCARTFACSQYRCVSHRHSARLGRLPGCAQSNL